MLRSPNNYHAAKNTMGDEEQRAKRMKPYSSAGSTENITPSTSKCIQQNMEPNDLINLIKDTINNNLDEKMKSLPTKQDIEDIKTEITTVSTEIICLRKENASLKEEVTNLKRKMESQNKDINWLQNQVESRKVCIKGLSSTDQPINEVRKVFKEILAVYLNIMESASHVKEIFRNTKKLAGSKIRIERDLIPTRQASRKVSQRLKTNLLNISKDHKILVREDRIRIENVWFF